MARGAQWQRRASQQTRRCSGKYRCSDFIMRRAESRPIEPPSKSWLSKHTILYGAGGRDEQITKKKTRYLGPSCCTMMVGGCSRLNLMLLISCISVVLSLILGDASTTTTRHPSTITHHGSITVVLSPDLTVQRFNGVEEVSVNKRASHRAFAEASHRCPVTNDSTVQRIWRILSRTRKRIKVRGNHDGENSSGANPNK